MNPLFPHREIGGKRWREMVALNSVPVWFSLTLFKLNFMMVTQEVSEYVFVYGSQLRKCQFSVDSYLKTQRTRQPPQSSSKRNLFVRVRFGGVPSTVEEVVQVRFCCLLGWKTNTVNTGWTALGHRPKKGGFRECTFVPVFGTVVPFLYPRSGFWDRRSVFCTLVPKFSRISRVRPNSTECPEIFGKLGEEERMFWTIRGQYPVNQDPDSTPDPNVCRFSIGCWVGEVNPSKETWLPLVREWDSWKLQWAQLLPRPGSP